jgi:hypothetical protein
MRHRLSPIFVVVTVVVLGLSGAGFAASGNGLATTASDLVQRNGAAPTVKAKKKCKLVKKKVHGKSRKVRVCTKVKPSLPSHVSVTLDPAHAATTSISAASGATLSAGGATLTVPAGAVSHATRVTMTPVTRLGGLKGQVLGAVQFQPDGLRLLKPVTLTFDVSSTGGLEAFSYAGNGRDFHLYPLKVEAGKATLELFHFSGHGVAKQMPQPSVDALRTRLKTVVRPAVDAAQRTSDAFAPAVFVYTSWKAEVNQLGAAKRKQFANNVSALEKGLGVALRKLADEQHQLCGQKHDIVGTGKAINEANKLADLVDQVSDSALLDSEVYALKQRTKCEAFELDFRSTITWGPGANRCGVVKEVSRVRAENLKLNYANSWGNEEGLDYWSFETTPACDVNTGKPVQCTWKRRADEPFKAKLAPVSDWYAGESPPHISMRVNVGWAVEVRVSCGGTSFNDDNEFWLLGMSDMHHGLQWTIEDWKYIGEALFAERTYTGSTIDHGSIVTEVTTFTLRHTPE